MVVIFKPGADPVFTVGEGADPAGGRQHTILLNFLKNCIKLRIFGAMIVWTPG